MNVMLVPTLILATVFVIAIIEDVRARRIPNVVVLAGFTAGLFWHAAGPAGAWAFDSAAPGASGIVGALLAAFGMLVAFFPFYRLGIMGAGDVKLLAAIAAVLGASSGHWSHLVGLALSVLVTGGLLSVARMLVAGTGRAVLANLQRMAAGRLSRAGGSRFDARRDSADRMPYAIAIAGGTTLYLAGTWTGFLSTL
jgi:prepilin peptidase CpaA